jgi:hypothetical protein
MASRRSQDDRTIAGPNVPREFLGLARLFCNRVKDTTQSAADAVGQIAEDARRIVEKRPRWRPEHLVGFERQWRHSMPPDGRLSLEIERGKRELRISETRLIHSTYKDVRWSRPEFEQSVSLACYTFQLTTPTAYVVRRSALAIIGIHAIARRYERGEDQTDEAIAADISELASNHARLCITDGEIFALPSASGVWVGGIETVALPDGRAQRLLYVKSFLPGQKDIRDFNSAPDMPNG